MPNKITISVSKETKLKIVAAIPSFNTQDHIADVVAKTKKHVDEVIVIDDGSTDKTAEIARKAGVKVVKHPQNKGYGGALRSCFEAGRSQDADILVIIDGDGQHNPDEISQLLSPIMLDKADLVIGSRFIDGKQKMPGYRKFGIGVITFLWNIGSKTKVSDSQSGFRAYNKKIIKNMLISENGMSSGIEILEKLRKKNHRIQEIPITCSYENNNSHLNTKAIFHGMSVAFSVIKIRLKYAFKKVN
ncbi:MAG: glycosyltransferase family 2 protein [Chloroflexi bacterium]|nr:glycosyltransferase family 2 protein [Chloroflexota bacterium]